MSKTIGIYHRADLDGLACAAIMRLKYPDVKLIGWDYGDNPDDFFQSIAEESISGEGPDLSECQVIMADVSMPFGSMLEIANRAEGFLWVDHHAKAINELSPIFSGHSTAVMVGETGKAACELLWETLFPGKEIPLLVQCFGVYDTWRKENEYKLNWEHDILPVQMYFNTRFDPEFLRVAIKQDNINEFGRIRTEGRAMLDYERAQIRRAMLAGAADEVAWDTKQRKFAFHKTFILNANINPGRLADEVWPQYPDVEIVATYYRLPDGRWKYSLRSHDDGPDVAEIASMYGGGGHPNAAGFVHDDLIF